MRTERDTQKSKVYEAEDKAHWPGPTPSRRRGPWSPSLLPGDNP